MRIAMVSEHASPLAALGGVDAGGQNVHVAALARRLAQRGARGRRPHPPRRPRPAASACSWPRASIVEHVAAGPPRRGAQGRAARAHGRPSPASSPARGASSRPDVVHAHFWMSRARRAARRRASSGCPVVQTFHALGVVKRRYQGDADTSPPERVEIERDIVRRADGSSPPAPTRSSSCVRLGRRPRPRSTVVPCGVDLELFTPRRRRRAARAGPRRLRVRRPAGRAQGHRQRDQRARAACPTPSSSSPAGRRAPSCSTRPRGPAAARRWPQASGVADRVDLRGPGRARRAARAAALGRRRRLPCRGTSRSASCRWRRWPAACRSSATAVGGMIDTVVDGVTGRPRPAARPRAAGRARCARLLADPGAARAPGPRPGVRRARQLYDWGRVAAATLDVYAAPVRRAPPARGSAARTGRRAGARHLRGTCAARCDALDADTDGRRALGRACWPARLREGGRLLAVGQRRQRRAGPAPDRRAGRPLRDRAPAAERDLPARRRRRA